MRIVTLMLLGAAPLALAPCVAHAQKPDSQRAPALPPPPDTIAAGMRVRLHLNWTLLTGTILTLDRDSLILQQAVNNDQTLQTSIPLVCLTGAERGLPVKSTKQSALAGFAIGAVVGTVAGIIVNNQRGASQPPTPPLFLLGWTIGGGGLGAGTGALIASSGKKWEPASLPVPPAVSFEVRTALCQRWTAPR